MRAAVLVAALLFAAAGPAPAEEEGRRAFGPFALYDGQPDLIYLEGDIETGAAADFERALDAGRGAGTLILSSKGGYTGEAMIIARAVAAHRLDTYIPRGFGCYSACAYVYFAGANRRAVGQLGVHQVGGEGSTAVSVQLALADILEPLAAFGVNNRIIALMLRTPPGSMYVLDRSEVARFAVNRDRERSFDSLDQAFGEPETRWSASRATPCESIGAGGFQACVANRWIPTAAFGDEDYFYQTEDHRFGLVVTLYEGDWTRDELREDVLAYATDDGEDKEARVLAERTRKIGGEDFDVMLYSIPEGDSRVLYQHFYRPVPGDGAVQFIVYAPVAEGFTAAALIEDFIATVALSEGADRP